MHSSDYHSILNILGVYGLIMDTASRGIAPYDRLREVFTEDAVFDFTDCGGGVANGVDAIISVMSKFSAHPSGHHITNPVIDFADVDHATSLCKLISVEHNGAANTGHYSDELVRTGGGWRISRRKATVYFAR